MIGCLLYWSGEKNWRIVMPKGPGTYGSKRGRPPKKKTMPAKKKKKPSLPKRGQRTNANKKPGKRRM